MKKLLGCTLVLAVTAVLSTPPTQAGSLACVDRCCPPNPDAAGLACLDGGVTTCGQWLASNSCP